MRTRPVALAVAAAAALALAAPHPALAADGQTVLTTTLTGSEIPGGGDPDGSGRADLVIGPGNRVCFRLVMRNIGPIIATHVHEGLPGQIGVHHAAELDGPVVTLSDGTQIKRGCSTSPDAAAIVANPSNYYVNVHNRPFAGGALRGQLGD